jgi:hypothetical protein
VLERLGGRKFILSLVVIAAGVAVQVYSNKGLSYELIVLLLGVKGSFSLSNVMANKDGLKFLTAETSMIQRQQLQPQQQQKQQQSASSETVEPQQQKPSENSSTELQQLRQEVAQLAQAQGAILNSVANSNKLLAAALNRQV